MTRTVLVGLELAQARRAFGHAFRAPQHWITGKDYPDGATDTIPVKNFVGRSM